jgi:hypothetical protein
MLGRRAGRVGGVLAIGARPSGSVAGLARFTGRAPCWTATEMNLGAETKEKKRKEYCPEKEMNFYFKNFVQVSAAKKKNIAFSLNPNHREDLI